MTVACRALLYCLGLVGFFALTGAPPFTAPTMQAVMAMQVTKPSPPLASVRPDTPQYLARAIDQCLVKDPAGRWATGEALAEALRGDDSDAADVAPQVRNFQRAGEQTTATLLLLLFIVPILRVSEPKYPIIVAAAVLLMLALAASELTSKARAVLRDAFTHDDVRRAFEVEVTRRKAEIAAMQAGTDQATSKRAGRLLMSMMALGGALVGFGIKMVTDSDRGATWRAVGVGMIAASATLIAGGVMLMARTGSGHIEAESAGRLARIWTGAFGRRVFAIAAWLNRRQTSAAPAKP